MDDEQGAAVNETTEQPVKAEKPRGKCTGCTFEYQLGTARTGEHKGELVIRKHNSRTGPGLCSGASAPPEVSVKEHEYEDSTGVVWVHPGTSEECDTLECCPHPNGIGANGCAGCGVGRPDVVGVAPGGTPITFICSPRDMDGAPVGEPFDAVGAITLGTRPVDPFTAPAVVVSDTPHEVVPGPGGTLTPHTVLAPDVFTAPVVLDGEADGRGDMAPLPVVTGTLMPPAGPQYTDYNLQPDPWTAPAPASLIPESTTTVSGQPEPDRDRWSRYLIHGQAHTRATTFAKLGANTKAIEAWNERNVIRGLTLRPDLLMLANGLEVKRDRNDLNSIAAQAKDAAGSKVAANIGTAYHAFSERIDAHLMTLPEVPQQYQGRVFQYIDALARAGLMTRPEWIERTTAVRADQVGAPLPVAGTLDRIFQLPDGSLVIGDLKTGSDLSYGEMEIEVQLALYAHGVNTHGLFDWNTKTWQDWESDHDEPRLKVRTDIAIVVHLPADGDGCTLYVADIERGWRDAQRLGPLQASLKEKSRFRTLTAADLAPRREPYAAGSPVTPEEAGLPTSLAEQQSADAAHANDQWELAKGLFSSAPDQHAIAQLYQFALDSGRFHQDQLAVLVGLGKDRLETLARG